VLEVDGERIQPRPSFGWATAFRVIDGGRASLAYETPPARRIALIVQVGLWVLVVAVAAIGRLRRRAARRVSTRRWRAEPLGPDLDDLDDVDERVTIIAPTDLAPEPLDAEAFPAVLSGATDGSGPVHPTGTLADLAPPPLPPPPPPPPPAPLAPTAPTAFDDGERHPAEVSS
jgi:hypothetical protein